MTKIYLRNQDGTLKASISTHHDERTYIRDLTVESMKAGGVFSKFGVPGDSITVEDMNFAAPGAGKLALLSSSSYLPYEDEPDYVTVKLYRIVDERVADEIDEIVREGAPSGLEDFVLDILHLTNEAGDHVLPGAAYLSYEVERACGDLILVKEIKSLNI